MWSSLTRSSEMLMYFIVVLRIRVQGPNDYQSSFLSVFLKFVIVWLQFHRFLLYKCCVFKTYTLFLCMNNRVPQNRVIGFCVPMCRYVASIIATYEKKQNMHDGLQMTKKGILQKVRPLPKITY